MKEKISPSDVFVSFFLIIVVVIGSLTLLPLVGFFKETDVTWWSTQVECDGMIAYSTTSFSFLTGTYNIPTAMAVSHMGRDYWERLPATLLFHADEWSKVSDVRQLQDSIENYCSSHDSFIQILKTENRTDHELKRWWYKSYQDFDVVEKRHSCEEVETVFENLELPATTGGQIFLLTEMTNFQCHKDKQFQTYN